MVKSYLERDKLAQRFANTITNFLDVQLIVLFGSTAQKMDLLSSDIDIAIIGNNEKLTKSEKNQISNIILDALLQDGIVINWVYIPLNQWERNMLPLIKEIRQRGKILWVKEKTEEIWQ